MARHPKRSSGLSPNVRRAQSGNISRPSKLRTSPILTASAVIVDVERTPACTYDEVESTKAMLDRIERGFSLKPGSLLTPLTERARFLGWLVGRGIAPHISGQRTVPVVRPAGGGVWSRTVDPGVPLGPGLLGTCVVLSHARAAIARMIATAIMAKVRKLIELFRS
jgi:hypothetical protein